MTTIPYGDGNRGCGVEKLDRKPAQDDGDEHFGQQDRA